MENFLTVEQKIILYLTAKSIGGNVSLDLSNEQLASADWKRVFLELKAHTVGLITFEHILEFKKYISEATYKDWKAYSFTVLNSNYKVLKTQNELVKILDNKYEYVILKGFSAGAYYDKAELRTYGDVDFLIDPTKKEELDKLFKDLGYKQSNGDHPNHLVYQKDGVPLEMHFEVAGVPYKEMGERVKSALQNVTKSYIIKEFEGNKFNVPTDYYHALILLLHTSHHLLGEGIGLRHLSDWAVFVTKTKNGELKNEQLLSTLKQIGLYKFFVALTSVCKKYLGISVPEYISEEDEYLQKQLLLDILSSGNFGVKDENRAKSSMMISEHGKDGVKHGATYNLAHALHKAVLRKKAVKKCPILYPFVYVYKALKFLVLSAIGKKPSLIKMAPQARKRKQIYEKLKIFELEKGE